ncbi:MAG: hypothetical protein PHP26_04990, partial [Syntrophomonas sp.]|nr:hypothetical protein [Syntrophomonas sp.]
MPNVEQLVKKIYGETASLVVDSCLKGELGEEQMRFLLNLLDLSVVSRQHPELFLLLQEWMDCFEDSETDKIIEATLLALDFNDQEAIK